MINENKLIALGADIKPQLIVVVDTEEEFDWSKPPDRNATSVSAMSELYRVQDIFDEYNIVPCYVIDYPVAANPSSVALLKEIFDDKGCEIGAHLHPWVNPPHCEALTFANMYPGNLPKDTEYNKLKTLKEQIEQSFGDSPHIYKAGRYGIGPNTARIMESLGFDIDVSICTGFNYEADGGPDFSQYTSHPYWFGQNQKLLEIPLSGGFIGAAGRHSKTLYDVAGHLDLFKARWILSRLSIVDRLILSPEGYTPAEHVKLTRSLLDQGLRTFTWNFHSPTVVAGTTGYTKNKRDVNAFLDSFRYYFDFFFGELNGEATTPTQLKSFLKTVQ